MPPPLPEPCLVRAIGPWSLGANAVNLSLGAGIFALPAAVAAILGPAAVAAYLVCGLAIALVLLCFAEVGSQVSRSGGTVAYIEDAFGPMAGFVAWAIYALAFCVASDAAIANVFLDAIATAMPALGHGAARAATLVILFGGLAAINVIGVRQGIRFAVGATVAKVVPLLLVLAVGAFAMRWQELRWGAWPAAGQVGQASLLLFFAFSGAEAALTPSGEIHDPARTVPRGMMGGTVALILLYVSLQAVSQGVLGPELIQHPNAPLAAVAGRLLGPAGFNLIIACTALAVFGTLAGDLLASPRSLLPMAENGILPRRLAAVHPRFRTPHVAIISYAAAACALAVSGAFKPLAVLSSVALLVVYLALCAATLRLRAVRPRQPGAFRAPGGPLVPVLGAATVVWLLAHSTWVEAAAMAAAVLVAVAYYVARRR